MYFRHRLLRGNRTIKVSAGNLDAFDSPNMPPLAEAGIDIAVDSRAILRPIEDVKPFTVFSELNANVVLLRLFPSFSTKLLNDFLRPPILGVVLQCYGAGNIPTARKDVVEALRAATERGVIIISCTQCSHGGVRGLYETGKALVDIGVIPGADITPEAALTKLRYGMEFHLKYRVVCNQPFPLATTCNYFLSSSLVILSYNPYIFKFERKISIEPKHLTFSYVLAKDEWDFAEKRLRMGKNLRGEMTVLKTVKQGGLENWVSYVKEEDGKKRRHSLEGGIISEVQVIESFVHSRKENRTI